MLLVIFAAWFLITTLLRGASLDVFWGWFIQNTFWPDAPDLTLAWALGLSFIVSFLVHQMSGPADRKANQGKSAGDVIGEGIGMTLTYYASFWLVALLYHYVFGIGAA
jgi:hypothetical protein